MLQITKDRYRYIYTYSLIIKKTTHFERFDLRLLQQFSYNTHLKYLILSYTHF